MVGAYDVSTEFLKPAVPAPSFKGAGRQDTGLPKSGEVLEGDVLELDPDPSVRFRDRSGTVDLSKSTGRVADHRLREEHLQADYDPDDSYLRAHIPGPLIEKLGRAKEKEADETNEAEDTHGA